MILSTITQLAADFVNDTNQTRFSGKYTDAVNRAQEQFAMDSRALLKNQGYTTTAGTASYALPTDFILESSVIYDGLPILPISRHTLATLYPGTDYSLLTGTPTLFMIEPGDEYLSIILIPSPQDVKGFTMRYYPLPAAVSAGTDVILNSSTLMAQFHLGIAAFTGWLLLTYETSTPEILLKRNELLRIYNDSVNKAIEMFGNSKSESLRMRPK